MIEENNVFGIPPPLRFCYNDCNEGRGCGVRSSYREIRLLSGGSRLYFTDFVTVMSERASSIPPPPSYLSNYSLVIGGYINTVLI